MSVTYPTIALSDVSGMDPARTLVLSVNNRHARRIMAEFSALLDDARRVMAIPAVMPLSAWLSQAADYLTFDKTQTLALHMADSFGAGYLWQDVIRELEADQMLLDIPQAARLAADADRLLDDWRIIVQAEEATADYQRFMLWRARYRERLAELDADDSNQVYEKIYTAVREGRLTFPLHNLVLAGFNEVSPRLTALLETMQQGGTLISILQQDKVSGSSVRRFSAPDHYAEWQLAAQWACDQLDARPEGRYAIIAPQLENDAPLAHRVLHGMLGGKGLAFNIAVARPASEWPLVRAALAWLRVIARYAQGRRCTTADLGQALLAGGCAGHIAETSVRAWLDAQFRRQGIIDVNVAEFSQMLTDQAPQLATAWQACMEYVDTLDSRAMPAYWADQIRSVLQLLGFPGNARLDSHSYQTLEAFDQLIDRLGHQSPIVGQLGFGAAVAMLARMARETPFQPQRDARSRLDVLGLLESEGGRWDGVWVLGLTDEVLPASPQPNPLIPLSALRRVNAPRATPERELQWARTIYDALLGCSPEVIVSHPQQEGERELRPSPCIAELPGHMIEPQRPASDSWPLIRLKDDYGPPLQSDEAVRGGVTLIDVQARNPLWAFVRFRLGASELLDYTTEADQSVRGRFLHEAMELLWRMLGSQSDLQEAIRTDRLPALIDQVTAQAADRWLADFSTMLRTLEVQRAGAVLMRWLDLESRREPFQIVAVEQWDTWKHGSLELSVRLDRVDQLADGRLAVIDYKSGAAPVDPRKSWTRDRPVDLQLPFYAAVLTRDSPEVAALVLAQLHARRTGVTGVSDGDVGLEGLVHFTDWGAFQDSSWGQCIAAWRQSIEGMADEFSAGYAANRYVDKSDLDFCDVVPFLRLTEEQADDVETV